MTTNNNPRKMALRHFIKNHADYAAWRSRTGGYANMTIDELESEYAKLYGFRMSDAAVRLYEAGVPTPTVQLYEKGRSGHEAADEPVEPISNGPSREAVVAAVAPAKGGIEEAIAAIVRESVSGLSTTDSRVDDLALRVERLNQVVSDTAAQCDTFDRRIQAVEAAKPLQISIAALNTSVTVGAGDHEATTHVMAAMAAGLNVMLVGPAGSGKSTIAIKCAEALGRRVGLKGAMSSPGELTGYVLPGTGEVVQTEFRDFFVNGGCFILDEVDAGDPRALLDLQAALAGDRHDFPDGTLAKHPDFQCIATANTFGRGGNREYVGRCQLDAAFLDRWVVIEVGYDEALEDSLVGVSVAGSKTHRPLNPVAADQYNAVAARWVQYVRTVREKVAKSNKRVLVTPRATMAGIKLIMAGIDSQSVADMVIWKGLSDDQRVGVDDAIMVCSIV
jgi:MoxR-like ATPase